MKEKVKKKEKVNKNERVEMNEKGILIFTGKKDKELDHRHLVHVEADDHTMFVSSKYQPEIKKVFVLSHLEKLLPEDMYMRTHKAHLVNLSCVVADTMKAFGNKGLLVNLKYTKRQAIVSERKVPIFLEKLEAYKQGNCE